MPDILGENDDYHNRDCVQNLPVLLVVDVKLISVQDSTEFVFVLEEESQISCQDALLDGGEQLLVFVARHCLEDVVPVLN